MKIKNLKSIALVLLCTMLNINYAWGGAVITYTLDGNITGGSNGYATESDITQDGVSWKATGNTTIAPWGIGGNSISKVDRPIYSTATTSTTGTITGNIDSVRIVHGANTGVTVHSLTLIVDDNSNFSSPISTLSTTTVNENDSVVFTRPTSPAVDWDNCYYKIVYNMSKSGSGNKKLEFVAARFFVTSGSVKYTVSFNSNGGTPTPGSITQGSVGAAITLPSAPTKDGYNFAGWYTASSGGTRVGGASDSYTPESNITLYAQWTFDVTLHYNGTTYNATGNTTTYTLPTTSPYIDDACDAWKFHCWVNAEYAASTPTETAPSSTVITSCTQNGDAYAVYKHTEGGGGSETYNFTQNESL